MKKNNVKKISFKMFCLSLCFIFALNLVVITQVTAAPKMFMNDDFEGEAPLSKYINAGSDKVYKAQTGTAITIVPNATGKAVRFAATATGTSNKDTLIGQVVPGGITFEAGKTYIFETEFSTASATGRKEIFRYGSSSNTCFMIVRNVSGSSYLVYPNTKSDITVSASSYIMDAPIVHNKTYRFTFVVDGTTRKYDLYIDGVKATLNANNNIGGETGFAPLPEQISESAPLRMYSQIKTLGDATTFDNILAYKVDSFDVLNTNTTDFMALNKEINVKFTDIVDANNAGTVSVYQGNREISGTQTVKGNVISLTLDEALSASSDYTLKISGTQDLHGNTLADQEIPFTTSSELSYLENDFENDSDFSNYTYTSTNTGVSVDALTVSGEENKAVAVSCPAPTSGSYTTTFTRYIPTAAMTLESGKKYVFSARVKSDIDGNQRKMFVYGSGTDDYLFNIKDVPNGGGILGAFKTNVSTTRIGDWNFHCADGWMEFMVVLDGTTKTYNLFEHGQKLNEEPLAMTNAPESIETIGFAYVNYSESVNYFDDIKIYPVSGFNRVYSSTEDYDVVSTYERQINLSYDLALNPATLDTIAISDNDENAVSCTATLDSADSKKLVINIDGNLLSNTNYEIDLSGVRDEILGDVVPENISFTTDDALNISFPIIKNASGEALDTLETGEITASVNVNKAKYTGEATPFTLVIAYYKDTMLLDLDVATLDWEDITDTDKPVSTTVSVDDASEGTCVKVFTMNNLEDIIPFRKSNMLHN